MVLTFPFLVPREQEEGQILLTTKSCFLRNIFIVSSKSRLMVKGS